MDLWYVVHAAEELQHEHANGPYVGGQAVSNFGGVAFTERKSAVGLLDRPGGRSLRSSIKCGPDMRLHPSPTSHCRIPKVREQHSVGSIWRYRTEYVLGLDVSMGNAFAVDVNDAAEDLTNNPSNLDLFEGIVLC